MLGTSEPLQLKVDIDVYIWVFPKIGIPPKWMVKVMENPMSKWMIWGENPPILGNTHIPRTQIGPLVLIGISALF